MPGVEFPGRNIIQIAGIMDQREADMITGYGVDLLGFPLRIASGCEDLSESDARDIIGRLQPPARAVLITYVEESKAIAKLCRFLGVSIVQLHGDVSPGTMEKLRKSLPTLRIIKSLIVRNGNLDELKSMVDRTSRFVEAYITDTFDASTGARGATGKTHDWDTSRRLVEHSPHPVILAGGLTPANVRAAIRAVRPAGVDAHTGVETEDGRKSPELVDEFVSEARTGFEAVQRGRD